MSSQINLDCVLSSSTDTLLKADVMLETTKTLYRLYGRLVAQRYFTKHFCFDTITITVK